MNPEQWAAVDAYFESLFAPPDPALSAALAASAAANLPEIHISPLQGKLLMVLAQVQGAQAILEIGTLGGYSTIWLARALPPEGRLISLEADPKHAEIARRNLAAAGLAARAEVRLGTALETLAALHAAQDGPFDVVFIDADKQNNANYLAWALKLARPGSLIICDNVVRRGRVADTDSADPAVTGSREFLAMLAADPRLSAVAVQTVGSKGYDGFTLARVMGA